MSIRMDEIERCKMIGRIVRMTDKLQARIDRLEAMTDDEYWNLICAAEERELKLKRNMCGKW